MLDSTLAATGASLTVVGLAITLVAYRIGRRGMLFVGKPAASVGFLVVALGSGGLESRYGIWVLTALVLSLLGDSFLMFRDKARFLAGLTAFFLAHVVYVGAFIVAGVEATWAIAALAGAVVVAIPVGRWLMPQVGRGMQGPVMAYVVVISVMLVFAVGTRGAGHTALIVIGALLFYLSDLFVARERFVTPAFANRLMGLPLYFTGQVLLALSVAA